MRGRSDGEGANECFWSSAVRKNQRDRNSLGYTFSSLACRTTMVNLAEVDFSLKGIKIPCHAITRIVLLPWSR